ncbi:uncharacterized protein LOC130010309 [Patella vulgata]|uniref:uncharacterized protein LOC130010309 n=1 Tax=Patella vulgata TaxID=6465 RepID=UPI0021802C83|nr:uncharacterized protein LOC130010309 [Patella vulgata]XP_050395229.1 uncharacterized protein LOC130010309 [Patella vulgata]
MASSKVNVQQKLKNDMVVFVECGDIFSVKADVLVYSSGSSKKNPGAIARQLDIRGGVSYRNALAKLHKTHKFLAEGNVYELHPGDLYIEFKSIYLAVTTMYTGRTSTDLSKWVEKLKKLYSTILHKAEKSKIQMITLPILGSGLANGPVDKCIKAAIESFNDFKRKHLLFINIVSNDYNTYLKICDELKSRAPVDTKITSSSTSSKNSFKKSFDTDATHSIKQMPGGRSYADVTVSQKNDGSRSQNIDDMQCKTEKTKTKRRISKERSKSPNRQRTNESYEDVENNRPSNIAQRKRRPNLADKISKKSDNVGSSTNGTTYRQDGLKDKEEYPPLKNGNSDSPHDQFKFDEARKNRKTSRKSSEEYQNDDDCGDTSYSSIEDTVSDSIRKHKHKESSVDKICEHCRKVNCGFSLSLTCGHTVCGKCGGKNEVCPSIHLSTCEHCNKKFTGPDCSLSCGHRLCLKCGAANDVCPIARGKDPEYENTLQREMQNGSDEEEDDIETCAICMDVAYNPKCLSKCGHVFCTDCIETCFKLYKPVCPTCGTTYGILKGDQPTGVMKITKSYRGVEGEENCGCYEINYAFSSGVQDENHPNPGTRYLPTSRTAYLPATTEGKNVCKMLIVAFKRKLIFTVGRSTTTGQENRITWNDIHHKTSMSGGPTHFGFPDPTYLNRVKEELASKGITEDDIRDVRLRDSEVIYA